MSHFTTDVEPAGEFGWVRDGDFDEDDVVGISQVVVADDLAKFVVTRPDHGRSGSRNEPDGPAVSRMKIAPSGRS